MHQLNIAQQAARAFVARLALSGIILVPAISVRLSLPDIPPSEAAPAQESRSFQPTGYASGGSPRQHERVALPLGQLGGESYPRLIKAALHHGQPRPSTPRTRYWIADQHGPTAGQPILH